MAILPIQQLAGQANTLPCRAQPVAAQTFGDIFVQIMFYGRAHDLKKMKRCIDFVKDGLNASVRQIGVCHGQTRAQQTGSFSLFLIN